ncbi:MAG: hypothetical protein KME17_27545 [Cyanosarcina radialis HA8281-LM2]|jgi:hypothetical protein|nr:hypothetical protein [Cyanosarcina radialis HA8281-LM2]
MTWIFSLSAECGVERATAEQFARHFDNVSCRLSNGSQIQYHAEIFQDIEENWWCRVSPSGISEIGIDAPQTAYLMTELGILLYQCLRSAPSFRYALVGVEVDEFRTYSELLEESPTPTFPGLVLAEQVWQTMGAAPTFRSFSLGYVWQPYEGEAYKPLLVSPELKDKLNELSIVQ